MEFINKKDLLTTISEVYERKYSKCEYKPLQDVYNMIVNRINRAQVINVNDIVHCKECKYWKYIGHDPILEVNFGECKCEQWASAVECPTDADDYCSFGMKERLDDFKMRYICRVGENV